MMQDCPAHPIFPLSPSSPSSGPLPPPAKRTHSEGQSIFHTALSRYANTSIGFLCFRVSFLSFLYRSSERDVSFSSVVPSMSITPVAPYSKAALTTSASRIWTEGTLTNLIREEYCFRLTPAISAAAYAYGSMNTITPGASFKIPCSCAFNCSRVKFRISMPLMGQAGTQMPQPVQARGR